MFLFWVLLGFPEFYWVLLGFTEFYWVSLSFTGFYRLFTKVYLVLAGFYWVLMRVNAFYCVLPLVSIFLFVEDVCHEMVVLYRVLLPSFFRTTCIIISYSETLK